jgi:hypothetical protein
MWIKVVERGGTKLKQVCKSNPLATPGCKRVKCGICSGDKPGRCDMQSAGYRCICKECEKEGVVCIYEGESGRTGFLRFLDHKTAVDKKKVDKSAVAKHMQVQHNGMKGQFSMEVTGTFQSCLTRLGDEGMRVRAEEEDENINIVMNSRAEFNQPPLVRILAVRGNVRESQDPPGPRFRGRGGARGGRRRGQ